MSDRIQLGLGALALVAAGVTGCYSEEELLEWGSLDPEKRYSCIRSAEDPEVADILEGRQPLFVHRQALWWDAQIPVCWEWYTYEDTPEQAADRELVREAIANTWEAALAVPGLDNNLRVHFTGWDVCPREYFAGIRIEVVDDAEKGPRVKRLGRWLTGYPGGMRLNFSYKNWNPDCSTNEIFRKHCIYSLAVHEFGHALGFAHEQNRVDTPEESCADSPQGTIGDLFLGQWDIHSTMNYCNPVWNNAGVLSAGDAWGAQAAYYPGLFDFECTEMASLKRKMPEEVKAYPDMEWDGSEPLY